MAVRHLAISGPDRCEGCPYRTRTCGTRGPEDSPFVIVGEAPGSKEIAKGEPFVGPSGVLLNRTLARYGLMHGTAFITNAMVCRPKDSPPTRAAIEACRSRLAEQLEAHPRSVILVLGNSALRSITGNHKLKITSARGKAIEHELGLLVPTFHPANILRNAGEFPRFASDIAYAAKLLRGGDQKSTGECQVTVINKASQLEHLLDLRGRSLACDIETTSLNVRDGDIISLGLAYAKNKVAVVPEAFIDRRQVKQLFEDQGTTFIWHNGKYDTSFLRRRGIAARVDEDTMLMHYSLDESKATHDLGQLATELLGAPDYKAEFRRKLGSKGWAGMGERARTEPDFAAELHRYNALDCDSTRQLFFRFEAEMNKAKNEPSRKLYREHLLPASDFLRTVEGRGIYVDRRYLTKLRGEQEARRDAALDKFLEAVEEANIWNADECARDMDLKKVPAKLVPGNSKHILWLMNKVLPIHVPDVRELTLRNAAAGIAETAGAAGAVGASRKKRDDLAEVWKGAAKKVGKGGEAAAGVSGTVTSVFGVEGTRGRGLSANRIKEERSVPIGVPILSALLDWREARKNLTTWIYGIEKRVRDDGRIHSTFNLHGTETGRLSSRDPNLQNIPVLKATRNMFAAEPGSALIELDYGQAELRLLAHLSDDEWLKEIYRGNRDLHTEVALHLYGEGYSYQQRMRAKAVNFGIAYGRTAYSLMGEFGISQNEAQRMVDEWFERAPRVRVFLDKWRSFVKAGVTEPTPFGRRRRFPMITAELFKNLQNEAANFPMQSTASDLTLVSAMRIDAALEPIRKLVAPASCGVINLVHDSILLEVPAQYVEAIAAKASAIMSAVPAEILKASIPFTVDWHSAVRWGDCK